MVYWFLFFTCILIGEKAENEWEWVGLWEELVPSGYSGSTAMQFLQSFEKIATLSISVLLSHFVRETAELLQKAEVR